MDPLDDRLTRAGAAWREAQPPVALPIATVARAHTPGRWWGIWRMASVAAAAAMAVAALWVVSPRNVVEQGGGPERRPVVLLTEVESADHCLFVHLGGELGLNGRSGLGLVGEDGVEQAIRWPAGYTAFEAAGHTALVDDAGNPVAMAGDPIAFGSAGTDGGVQTACRPSLDPERRAPDEYRRGNRERPFTQVELTRLARAAVTGVGPAVAVATITTTPMIEDGEHEADVVGWLTDQTGFVPIHAGPDVVDALAGTGLLGTFAFHVEAGAVRLIGPVELGPDGILARSVAEVLTYGSDGIAPDDLVAIDGWLQARRWPARCFSDKASSPAPCSWVRLDGDPDPGDANDHSALQVDDAAWDRYGIPDGLDTGIPRPGSWLVRRTDAEADGQAWEVVARLDTVRAIDVALPTLPPTTGDLCRGVGLGDMVLVGDPSDPRVAWLVTRSGGRTELVWPAGYRARFAPGLEVLDETGTVVFREGDRPTGACVTGSDAGSPLRLLEEARPAREPIPVP